MPKRDLWPTRRRLLERAGSAFQRGAPESLHDLRVALRRVAGTATAAGSGSLAQSARKLLRSLSELRQLEVDRELLDRVRRHGLLSPEAAAGLDARWEEIYRRGERESARRLRGKRMRRLRRKLGKLARRPAGEDLVPRLEKARRKSERAVASPPREPDDRALHRYRLAVKRARDIAEDLVLAGVPAMREAAARERRLQDALGRWNDLRLFSRRLAQAREEAERRGAVSLALELDRLFSVLGRTLEAARGDACESVRAMSNVLAFGRRTA